MLCEDVCSINAAAVYLCVYVDELKRVYAFLLIREFACIQKRRRFGIYTAQVHCAHDITTHYTYT